jgi:hypothetical protein
VLKNKKIYSKMKMQGIIILLVIILKDVLDMIAIRKIATLSLGLVLVFGGVSFNSVGRIDICACDVGTGN